MSIRSTCKAIVIDDGKILLNRCVDPRNGEYFSLPGGGQETDEFLDEAVVREVLEETGYTVETERFVGLGEEICQDPVMREKFPAYIHKMYHIYLCHLASREKLLPTETDEWQQGCVWIPLEEVMNFEPGRLLPDMVHKNLDRMVNGEHPVFLDSARLRYHHG